MASNSILAKAELFLMPYWVTIPVGLVLIGMLLWWLGRKR